MEAVNITDKPRKLVPGVTKPKLPVIRIMGGGLSNEATKAEEYLVATNVGIYQRDNKLVRAVTKNAKASNNRDTIIVSLVIVTKEYMRDMLCKHIFWLKGTDERTKKINPPKEVVDIILNRQGEWKFPQIRGVISAQTLRPNGTVLSEPGYDKETQLLLIEPPPMPPIKESPMKEDAYAALLMLKLLLSEFPFADKASKSVALSAMISTIIRGAMSVAPGNIINANTPGTGKSFLQDIISSIATGQLCPVFSAGKNEEELEKRIGSAVIAGQPIVAIDNVNGEIGGDCLCQIIERPIVNIRILGKSEFITIDSNATIFANGNNIRVTGDLVRRVIISNLNANIERPELREFSKNPIELVLANRGKYIAAILTIVRAYIVAGSPNLAPPLASFNEWSNLVRSALIWLDQPDPLNSMEDVRANDPIINNLATVLFELKNAFGSQTRTTRDIITQALTKDSSGQYIHLELRDALIIAASGKTDFMDSKALGKYFANIEGRIINSLKLRRVPVERNNKHPVQWWVEEVNIEQNAVDEVESG